MALVLHPGQLTTEFRDGMRIRSISPWRIAFNVLTVVFLLSFVTGFGAASFPNQDPSGTLARMTDAAQQQSKIDKLAFMERVDRRFNGIFTAMIALVLLWEFRYLLLALRRVYADSWISAGAKTAGMLLGGFIVDNGLAILSFYLALWASFAFG